MYKRILVPVDGSQTSNKALVAALRMARNSGGRVRLVHVLDELTSLRGDAPYGGYLGELIRVMQEAGTKVRDDAMAISQAAGVEGRQHAVRPLR